MYVTFKDKLQSYFGESKLTVLRMDCDSVYQLLKTAGTITYSTKVADFFNFLKLPENQEPCTTRIERCSNSIPKIHMVK